MKSLTQLWLIVLGLKLLLVAFIPMSLDESYYWVWGKELSLSYFDHPPFVSWLFYLGQLFDNFGSASKWPGVIMGHLTLLIWIHILKPLFTETQLKWWFILAVLSPLMGTGSLVLTPDIPLLFFWSLSTYFFLEYLKTPKTSFAILLGACIGLGFVSKYHMVLFPPVVIVYLISQKMISKKLLQDIGLCLVSFVIFTFPVWYWNLNNDFISFKFQFNHGLGKSSFEYKWLLKYLGDQILLIWPPIVWMAIKNKANNKESKWMFYFAALPLAFFAFTSLRAPVEANWTAVAMPSVFALALYNRDKFGWVKGTVVVLILLNTMVISHSIHNWLPFRISKIDEFNKYDPVIKYIKENKLENVYGESYQMTSILYYTLKRPIYKLKGLNRMDHYDLMPESTPKTSEYVVFLSKETPLPEWTKKAGHKITKQITIEKNFVVYYIKTS